MQQAIEEGFILDVLQNYTPYKLAFKLANNGVEYDSTDPLVDKTQASKDIMRWVRLHEHNISQKVAVIVEHFRENVMWRLDGQAKAMVVTASRVEAVRYKLAFDKYVAEHKYAGLHALVAFSGEVNDPESGTDPFAETSMNTGLKKRSLPKAFTSLDFQVMIVANKFQTGFDQPLLVGMYVDKRLSGVTTVQTLSRLNRTATGKDQTFVLDFVNKPEDVLKDFKQYYRAATLADLSDPNIIHDLRNKLDQALIYEDSEVAGAAKAFVKDAGNNALTGWVTPAKERFSGQYKAAIAAHDGARIEELNLFRSDLNSFIRAYDFLSQIVNYEDAALAERSIFYRLLAPLIKGDNLNRPVDLSSVKLTHYSLRAEEIEAMELDEMGDPLKPFSDVGSGTPKDPEYVRLREIIEKMNTLFEGEGFSDADMLGYTGYIGGKFDESTKLRKQASANTFEQFMGSPDLSDTFMDAVIESDTNFSRMSEQLLGSPKMQKVILAMLARDFYEKHGREGAA